MAEVVMKATPQRKPARTMPRAALRSDTSYRLPCGIGSQREQRPCREVVRPQRGGEIPARGGRMQVRKREPVLDEESRRAGEAPLKPGRRFQRDSPEPLVLVDRRRVRLRLDVGDQRAGAEREIRLQRA